MFQVRGKSVAVCAVGLTLLTAVCANGAAPPIAVPSQHRVAIVIATDAERVVLKRAVDRGAVRTDLHDAVGPFATVIERADRQAVTLLVPERDLYIERPMARSISNGRLADLRSEHVARVKLDGRPAKKFRLSNAHGTAFLWVEPDTNYPIRLQDSTASVAWGPFEISPQPAELFEPPSRQTQLAIPDFLGGPHGALSQMLGDQMPLILSQQLGADLTGKIRRASRTPLGVVLGALLGPTWEQMLLRAP